MIHKHTQSCVTGAFDSTVSPAEMVVSSVTTRISVTYSTTGL